METFTLQPVGHVRGGRSAAEDDDWGASRCRIELDPAVVTDEATLGLDEFTHVEVVFLFDGVDPDAVCTGARHPRGNPDWPRVGILAQRAKDRPNRIGTTVCPLVGAAGLTIEVGREDASAWTPVRDGQPDLTGVAARGVEHEPAWATELMAGYW
jgi:tRNA (Thr-GGU) A37 N-methylase